MAQLVDLFSVLPKRHVDPRLSRLYRRFGLRKTFSVAEAAAALHTDIDTAFRVLMLDDGIEDSRFRCAVNNGKLWLLAIDPFRSAAHAWNEQYADDFRSLPVPFSASQFAQATGIPFPAANTLLSILVRYGHLIHTETLLSEGAGEVFRLPPRRTVRTAA
jgi:hypothetical protein